MPAHELNMAARDEIELLRKALGQERRRTIQLQGELDRANAGFEEFICVAAHNLRQSLREVASFSELLAETDPGRRDSEDRQFLERIRASTSKMQSLLADIVDYWAASSDVQESSRTEMEAALQQALLSIDKQITEHSAVITSDPLAPVYGDSGTLARVIAQLIRNGIEYCDTDPPRVHISCRKTDLECTFSVRDNGSGVEPEFLDRIFVAFKRLHGPEYPGNGLGLAFCKKTIERFGGRMWMESSPGKGSTVYFTLPAAE